MGVGCKGWYSLDLSYNLDSLGCAVVGFDDEEEVDDLARNLEYTK
jgi:hypothetical protein